MNKINNINGKKTCIEAIVYFVSTLILMAIGLPILPNGHAPVSDTWFHMKWLVYMGAFMIIFAILSYGWSSRLVRLCEE